MEDDKPCCNNCKFASEWVRLCMRYPPVFTRIVNGELSFDFPYIHPRMVCGEFVQKPLDDSPGV